MWMWWLPDLFTPIDNGTAFSVVVVNGTVGNGTVGWTMAEGKIDGLDVALTFLDNGTTTAGSLTPDCGTLSWPGSGTVWRATEDAIQTVHVIAMNHLDVG